MRKFIFIINAIELLQLLMSGKYVQGVLYIDRETGLLTFKAYNRKPRNRETKEAKSALFDKEMIESI